MPIDPVLIPVVRDMARCLRVLGVPFGIVGALVPELLLPDRPFRMTNDADVTVIVDSLADFETLKDRMAAYGFTRTRAAHRMQHQSGGLVDLLPFSEGIAPEGRLQLEDGVVMNMAGFDKVVINAIPVDVEEGLILPVTPLPLYVLLKLIAFRDRDAAKDLGSVLHCIERYGEQDDRRYEVEHHGHGVPFEYTCAYLIGMDAREFLDDAIRDIVAAVLDRFSDPHAEVVRIVARDAGWPLVDAHRTEIFERFRWYRIGIGL